MRLTALSCYLAAACFIMAACITSATAQTITGKVIDKRSNPVANAAVSLSVKNKSAITNAQGVFVIEATAILSPYADGKTNQSVVMNGTSLLFTNESPQHVRVELFDIIGKRCSAIFDRQFEAGSFSLPMVSLISRKSANGLYVIRITKGNQVTILPFSSLGNFRSGASATQSAGHILAKKLVTSDTLKVTKQDYKSVAIPFDSDLAKDFSTIKIELVNDPDTIIEKKVDSLLALLSDAEKIAQTEEVLVDIISTDDLKNNAYGSVFNGGGYPFADNKKSTWATQLDAMHEAAKQSKHGIPILYGIDAVHGNATIEGATVFPHNIGMGCTGDTALVAKMANITAKECRAVGINLNFGPAISVVRNEKWGRSYEGYGETPEINALMSGAYVRGLQGYGDLTRPDAVAACAKHFIGDGGTTDGINGGTTSLTEATIRAVHLPPYEAAVKERVASVMPSYNAWMRNGQEYRCTNDSYALTNMLKTGLNWDGFCLSDWDAIFRALPSTNTEYDYFDNNVSAAINAGIDMAMIAKIYTATDNAGKQKQVRDYNSAFTKTLGNGTIQKARLDDAVRRILRIKFRLNLFESAKSNSTLLAEFGSQAHRAVARECVQKSLVLLKNTGNALPLKTTEKVVVVGPYANKLGPQCGGWTIAWQGLIESPTIVGTTIADGIKEIGGASNVTYDANGTNLAGAEKIVLVIGEGPYAEGQGDHGFKNDPMSVSCVSCGEYRNETMSINLADCPGYSLDLVSKCYATGKPVIIVLLSGRPLIITQELEKCAAFVAAWLPGSEGGGVADVLYKVKPFSGKLTHTWPKSIDQIPVNTGTLYADEAKGAAGTALFEYGFGLTY